MIDQLIRRLREERGLSRDELGLATGLSAGHVSKLERGLTEPSVAVLQRLAIALRTPLADLYTAAGFGHLLEGMPDLDPALEPYVHQIDDLPPGDRDIIIGVLERILAEERAGAAEVLRPAPDDAHQAAPEPDY